MYAVTQFIGTARYCYTAQHARKCPLKLISAAGQRGSAVTSPSTSRKAGALPFFSNACSNNELTARRMGRSGSEAISPGLTYGRPAPPPAAPRRVRPISAAELDVGSICLSAATARHPETQRIELFNGLFKRVQPFH